MPNTTAQHPPLVYLFVGLLALMAAGFCAFDALQRKPTDGAEWKLGQDEIRIVGLLPAGPAQLATRNDQLFPIEVGDVIEGIDRKPILSPRQAAVLLRDRRVGEVIPYMVNRDGDIFEVQVRLGSTRTTDVTTYLIYCGLGLVYFLVGLLVFWKNPWQNPSRVFFLLGVVFLLYFFSSSGRSVEYYWSQVFSRNMAALSSLLVPPLFLHFFLIFPQHREVLNRHRWVVPLIYVLPLLYYGSFTYSQFFGSRPAQITSSQQMILGLYFTIGLGSLITTYLRSTDVKMRQKVKILTLGTVLGVLPYLVFTMIFEVWTGRSDFALFGAVPLVLIPVSFGYSIARYRLMDVEVIIRRSLIYAILTGLLVGAYFLIIILVGNVLLKASGQTNQIVAIIATLIVAAAFAPARDRIQAFLERRFFREKHDMQAALQELALAVPRTIERSALMDLVENRITTLFHPEIFTILLAENEALQLPESDGESELKEFSGYMAGRRSALMLDVLESQLMSTPLRPDDADGATAHRVYLEKELRTLTENRYVVVVPALAGDRLVAALCLGEKRSEESYDSSELELLTIVAGQMGVQLENTRLYDEAISRRQLEEELALARSIQQRLLPSRVPAIAGYDIAAINLPSRQISGDYYDFVSLLDGRMSLVISDVSGKGMGASLLASNLQASLRALSSMHNSPAAILKAVNTSLFESTDSDRFATLFFAALEPDRRRLLYSSAGHNPPLLRRADGTCAWLEDGATPLGAFAGMEYPETEVELNAGDTLVLYTDGVTEAEDKVENQFGEKGLLEVVCRHPGSGARTLAEEIKSAVFAHIGGKQGAAELNAGDDLTVVVLRATADSPEMSNPQPGKSVEDKVGR
jgi:sigma-B regulation protein RsbU (phosphoserine phosphatase)